MGSTPGVGHRDLIKRSATVAPATAPATALPALLS